jgi:tellurite resistance protein TerA
MTEKTSVDSIAEADRWRAEKSRYGGMGAAGYIDPHDGNHPADFLTQPGETAIVNPPAAGLPDFKIGVAWDVLPAPRVAQGFFEKLFRRRPPGFERGKVDLDVGCLYQLKDGTRGAIQAFGDMYGKIDSPPYLHLSGDERTGESAGEDEIITVSGAHWGQIQKIVIYVYIYGGADSWHDVAPQIQVRVPGERPMVVTLRGRKDELDVCAVAGLENVRGGIKMTSYLEYYPGHAEMDRAHGFGLDWTDGAKGR